MKQLQMHAAGRDKHTFVRERALAEGMKELAADLRLIDVVDLVAYIRRGQHANMNDLVASAAELFFKENTLRYGWAADIELKWGSAPSIKLDMEFQHRNVSVFFKLVLEALNAAIDIHYISFTDFSGEPDRATELLIEAIADARDLSVH
jgi:hypothetical protein